MFANSRFDVFDPHRSKWPRYCEQLKHYLIANKVEEPLKLSTVLSLVGDYTFNLLSDLIAPDLPSSKTVDEVLEILNQHFSPKPISRLERYKFRSRKQAQDESVSDFVAALRKLSLNCNFNDTLDINLADQFVMGIFNPSIQKRLLIEEDDTSFAKLVQIASIAEMTAKDSFTNLTNYSMSEVCRVQHSRSNKASVTSENAKLNCKHCGSTSHLPLSCKYKDAICNYCKKKGHISPICHAKHENKNGGHDKRIQSRRVHGVERDSRSVKATMATADSIILNHFSINKISENSEIKPFIFNLKINGICIDFELDSGAAISLIPLNIFKKNIPFVEYNKTEIILSAFNHQIFPIGKASVNVEFNNRLAQNLELFVVKEGSVPLIGRTWFKALGFLPKLFTPVFTIDKNNSMDSSLELNKLYTKYEELFSPALGTIKNFKAHIFVKEGAVPRFFKYRTVPFALLPKIEAELEKLQKQGILTPIKFSEWASPIVPILKKDNSLRICADYKVGLNPALLVDQYPLPIIDEILSKLAGGVIFSKLDLAQAYQQVLMDEESAKYLTINTHKGLFQVNRLPFGIASAPAIFQELMEKTLTGLPSVACYLDDILISSPDVTSHFLTLNTVLSKLQDAGIHLNKAKCEFLKEEVMYLGHKINRSGIHPSEDKIKSLLSAPEPKNSDQLRSFLGLVSYYRKFLPNLSTSLAPLNALLCKNTKWHWNKETSHAFLEIKKAVTSSEVLTHYDPKLPLILASDASPFGLGAVISHIFPDGSEHPIAFASRALTQAERNYSQLDKEALAIVYGVKKFHQYIFGRKFTLITDHKPLTHIFGPLKQIPIIAAARLQRWALTLSAYIYDIKFKDSKSNLNADALSRSPCSSIEHHPDEVPEDIFLINQIETFPISHQDIVAETIKDPILRQVLQFSKVGWPTSVTPDLVPYKSRSEEISHQDDCLLWGLRILIPNSLRPMLLKELHHFHTGMVKMKMIARSLFWWPCLDRDIERIAHSCPQCALQSNAPPKAPPHPWIRPDTPWERVHIDYAGPFMGHMFLVLVDAFSKWPEVSIMNSTDTISTATALEEFFTRYGYPLHLVTDNGTQFTSTKFETFCKNRGIHHTFSAPYHPSSNGQAERFVQILKRFLKTFQDKQLLNVRVNELLFSYRSTPHSLTQKPPAELFLGRNIRNRLHLIKPPIKPPPYEPISSTKPRSFLVGQQILTKSYNKNNINRWTPARISKKYGPLTYLLEFPDGKLGKRHVDQLRPSYLKEGVTGEPQDTDEFMFLRLPESVAPTPPATALPDIEGPRRYPTRVRRAPARFRPLPLRRE